MSIRQTSFKEGSSSLRDNIIQCSLLSFHFMADMQCIKAVARIQASRVFVDDHLRQSDRHFRYRAQCHNAIVQLLYLCPNGGGEQGQM